MLLASEPVMSPDDMDVLSVHPSTALATRGLIGLSRLSQRLIDEIVKKYASVTNLENRVILGDCLSEVARCDSAVDPTNV